MKKLLTAALMVPFTLTSCLTARPRDVHTVKGISHNGYSDLIKAVANGDVDLGASWGDARFYAGASANQVKAVGVVETRIANDGVQARGNLHPYDLHVMQQLFLQMIQDTTTSGLQVVNPDTNKTQHVLSAYNHSSYVKSESTAEKIKYLDGTEVKEATKLKVNPSVTGPGELFQNLTTATDYSQFKLNAGKTLNITFIPSNNQVIVQAAAQKLENFLDGIGIATTTKVASTYEAAGDDLSTGKTDIAFLPTSTWIDRAPNTNFILQASRNEQVGSLVWNGTTISQSDQTITNQKHTVNIMNELSDLTVPEVTTAKLSSNAALPNPDKDITKFKTIYNDTSHPLNNWARAVNAYANLNPTLQTTSYESIIWAKKDSATEKQISAFYNNGKYDPKWTTTLPNSTKYAYTSKVGGASYVYPTLWLSKHLKATIVD